MAPTKRGLLSVPLKMWLLQCIFQTKKKKLLNPRIVPNIVSMNSVKKLLQRCSILDLRFMTVVFKNKLKLQESELEFEKTHTAHNTFRCGCTNVKARTQRRYCEDTSTLYIRTKKVRMSFLCVQLHNLSACFCLPPTRLMFKICLFPSNYYVTMAFGICVTFLKLTLMSQFEMLILLINLDYNKNIIRKLQFVM